ncbi:MAG: RNA polymerase sigma factor [Bacteroidia bacterium]|nr:RNA polymerase sigma factor [Bacteroidia bacterium]
MQVDRTTIKECIKGDKRAQYRLYRDLYENFMGMCIRYRQNKEDATSSFNNGFVKILSNLSQVKDLVAFESWVKRILINQMLSELKKEGRERNRNQPIDEIRNESINTVENEGVQRLDAEYLKILLNYLPEKTRQVFNLFAIDGFSHKEIANLLGITEGTSKWHVADARKRLKNRLNALSTLDKIGVEK